MAGCDRGSFTAELAAGLPALMLLLLAGLTAVNAVVTKAHCVDAARDAALAAARGEPDVPAGRRAPEGAVTSVDTAGDLVTVTVRAPVRLLSARLPRFMVSATSVAAVEPGQPVPAAVAGVADQGIRNADGEPEQSDGEPEQSEPVR